MNEFSKIYTTREWGAREVRRSFALERPLGAIVHHTNTSNRAPLNNERAEKAQAFDLARSIQGFHMDDPDRRWADTGQNFTVSRGGLVLEGRTTSLLHARSGFVARGAHAGNDVGNRLYFGIEVEGTNLPDFKVTDPQWDALVKLCAWLSLAGNFQSRSIEGHGHFVATECPGKLMGHLVRLRAEVRVEKVRLMGEVA
jgi:hypothetical protein